MSPTTVHVLTVTKMSFLILTHFPLLISEGEMHDSAMLAHSGLLNDLEQYAFCHGMPMCVYGDPAPFTCTSSDSIQRLGTHNSNARV